MTLNGSHKSEEFADLCGGKGAPLGLCHDCWRDVCDRCELGAVRRVYAAPLPDGDAEVFDELIYYCARCAEKHGLPTMSESQPCDASSSPTRAAR